jgi:hypothetical protein
MRGITLIMSKEENFDLKVICKAIYGCPNPSLMKTRYEYINLPDPTLRPLTQKKN